MADTAIAKPNQGVAFRQQAERIAGALLTDWVGADRAKEATGRLSVSLSSAAAAAKDPKDFYECTPQSVATAIATAALTGIMPSTGAAALAYVIPQRPRKNERPQLQYMLSHRGLNALALRCGQQMIAVPIGKDDVIETSVDGDTIVKYRDIDNPPTTYDELRGVVVIVRRIESGQVIASQFVAKKLIDARKAMSRSASSTYGPWHNWPVEMAMKAAMHYAIGRGWCVIDDTEATRALSADVEADTIDTVATRSAGSLELTTMLTEQPADAEPDSVEDQQAAIAAFEASIATAADIDKLTELFEAIEQSDLPELAVERLHALAVERQEQLAK